MSKKLNLSQTKLKQMLEAAWWAGYEYSYSDPEPVLNENVKNILAGAVVSNSPTYETKVK